MFLWEWKNPEKQLNHTMVKMLTIFLKKLKNDRNVIKMKIIFQILRKIFNILTMVWLSCFSRFFHSHKNINIFNYSTNIHYNKWENLKVLNKIIFLDTHFYHFTDSFKNRQNGIKQYTFERILYSHHNARIYYSCLYITHVKVSKDSKFSSSYHKIKFAGSSAHFIVPSFLVFFFAFFEIDIYILIHLIMSYRKIYNLLDFKFHRKTSTFWPWGG